MTKSPCRLAYERACIGLYGEGVLAPIVWEMWRKAWLASQRASKRKKQ